MKRNNKGYSMLEVIIAIAIIAVIVSGSTISLSLIYNTRVSTAAKRINSYCKAVRLNNMTKQTAKHIHIYRKDGGNYLYIDDNMLNVDVNAESEELGSSNMSIQFSTNGTNYTTVDRITLTWGRNGEFKVYNGSGAVINNVAYIRCINDSKTSVLTFSQVTGKVVN